MRLFDGSTVRSTFPRTATLAADVRPWLDAQFAARERDAETPTPHAVNPPYYFKQILAPLPSRELSAGEEGSPLGEIDLAPSATLVLVPVKGYSDAYASGSRGIVSGPAGSVFNIVGGAFNLAGSAVGYVGGALSAVLGGGTQNQERPQNQQQQQQQQQNQQQGSSEGRSLGSAAREASPGIRVRTLADQRAGEQREQLYNGNQVRSHLLAFSFYGETSVQTVVREMREWG